MVLWFYDHSIVHGFRSPVRGVLPIPFAPHVPRIVIFCLTRRCRPVLLPAGSIRSSSPSGWYENCFKPMALQVRGSPLRPSGSASGFSRPCRCPCWGKTGRNCISQGHSWKLTYLLKDLCIFFWGGCCNVNFGMVDLAAQTVWLHWMRCHPSGIHSIKWLGHIPIAPANMTEIMVSQRTLDIQLVTAGEKNASRWNAILPKFVKKAATDLHRFDFDGLRHKHGGSVFLGMEFAAIAVTVWLNWTRSQSFKTSLDQMTRSHCIAPANMQGLWFPQRLLIFNWWQLAKKYWESMERHPAKVCQNGCYRLASLWFGLGLLGRCVHSSQNRKKPAWYGSTIPLDQFCDCPG